MKYDDILIPTDEIYLRIKDTRTEKERLEKVKGFKMKFLGRWIGVHRSISNWMWQATDLATGAKLNPYDYIKRASLIDFLFRNEADYKRMFERSEVLDDSERTLIEMRNKIEDAEGK